MLYIDTNLFFLHFFVEEFAKEINARPHLRDAFEFSKINNGHLFIFKRCNADLNAGEVVYFKDETMGNPIVEYLGLRPNMYSFTVCDESEPIPELNYPMDIRHKPWRRVWRVSRSSASSTKITFACTMEELWPTWSIAASVLIVTRCAW